MEGVCILPSKALLLAMWQVTLGVIWSATFLFAFFYYAYKYNATAPVDGGETVIQSVAKPAYCRNDMPGVWEELGGVQ